MGATTISPSPEQGRVGPPATPARSRSGGLKAFWRDYRKSASGVAGLVVLVLFGLMALLAPVIADPAGLDVTRVEGPILAPPSVQYPLGTDDLGRSVWTLVAWGSRISLLVGILAAAVSMVVGAAIGIAAGFRGGIWDTILMRITDWFLVLPWLALAITLAAILGQSLFVIVMVIGLTSWPWTARLVRSQTLSVRERPYVERATGLGGSTFHVVRKHVLPNVMPVILAQTILSIAVAILSESTLSFIGLGDPLRPSWGAVLETAFAAAAPTLGAWWWIGAPGVCIVLVVLAFTLCGNAIEEILNPRLRTR